MRKLCPSRLFVWTLFLGMTGACAGLGGSNNESITLHTRSRGAGSKQATGLVRSTESWDSNKTAIIICDMWDNHWCKGAAQRVAELAGPMNEMTGSNAGLKA